MGQHEHHYIIQCAALIFSIAILYSCSTCGVSIVVQIYPWVKSYLSVVCIAAMLVTTKQKKICSRSLYKNGS